MKHLLSLLLLLPAGLLAQGGFARQIDLLTELAGDVQPMSVHRAVFVKGYHFPGDGGGGWFFPTNTITATNLGTRIDSSYAGWSWDRLTETNEFNVKWFGAKGDGTTDDATAIQSTIDAAEAAEGTVYFPSGTYVSNTSLANDQPIRIMGYGATLTVSANYATQTAMLRLNGAGTEMYGLTIDGNDQVMRGLSIDPPSGGRAKIRDVTIQNITAPVGSANTAAGIQLGDEFDYIEILNCRIDGVDGRNTGDDVARGINAVGVGSGGGSLLVQGCWIGNITVNNEGINDADGISINNISATDPTMTVRVIGNQFWNCDKRAVKIFNPRAIIQGNSVYWGRSPLPTEPMYAVFSAYGADVTVDGNDFVSEGLGDNFAQRFVDMSAGVGSEGSRLVVTNNRFRNSIGTGAGTGTYASGDSRAVHIVGNTTNYSEDLIISGNQFYNLKFGIYMDANADKIRRMVVTGNAFSGLTSRAIQAFSGSDISELIFSDNSVSTSVGSVGILDLGIITSATVTGNRLTTGANAYLLEGRPTSLLTAYGNTVNGVLDGPDAGTFNVLAYGATADGTTDDTAAIQAAIDAAEAAGGGVVFFPNGNYRILSAITVGDKITIQGAGEATVLDVSGVSATNAISATGSVTQIEELGADIARNDSSITFASAPSLAANDVFIVYNPTNSSWSNFRTYYRAGEYFRVRSVSGSVVTTSAPAYAAYVVASVDVYKLTPVRVQFRDFRITGGATAAQLITVTYGRDCVIHNVRSTHADNACVFLDRCYDSSVSDCELWNLGDGAGNDYGLIVSNSQNVAVANSKIHGRRHSVTITGSDVACSVPNRNIRIAGCTLENDRASNLHNADFHGNTEASVYEGCTIYNGATWQGKDNGYLNCTFYGEGNVDTVIYSAEIYGGTHYLRGCLIESDANPMLGSRGIIDVGGNSSAVTADTVEDLLFIVSDCTFRNQSLSSSSTFLEFTNRGSAVFADFVVENVVLDVNDLRAVLYTDLASGTANTNFSRVSGASFSGAAKRLILHNGGHYETLDFTAGDENVTLTSGTGSRCLWYGTALTTNRTITLTGVNAGDEFFIKTAGIGGTYTVDVGGLKTLADNQWAHVVYTGASWQLFGFGSL